LGVRAWISTGAAGVASAHRTLPLHTVSCDLAGCLYAHVSGPASLVACSSKACRLPRCGRRCALGTGRCARRTVTYVARCWL